MPNLEWKALGEEPGCRQAAMDPQIKLFGRILSATPSHTVAGADAGVLIPKSVSSPSSQDGGDNMLRGTENKIVSEKLVSARSSSADEFLQLFKNTESCGAAPVGAQQQQQQNQPLLCDDSEGGQSDEQRDSPSGNSDGKKPDKVVACPRCLSQDTKFCYYNNYNVNQPRHFCKNCQRYWTAGGTLRNVPVGAGRRKNKTGNLQQQRENEASQNGSSFQLDSGEFSCGLGSPKAKLLHPKRLPGQGSPLRSPGSSSPFGSESGIAMCSPPYSLYQNGRLPFQSFNSCSQGFTTPGTELSAVGSSDTASTLRGQRLICLPAGVGVDKDCCRSPRSEQVQDASMLQQQREATSDTVSEWAGNTGGPSVRFFNGEWPHGYNLDWDGKHAHPVSQGFAPVLTSYNTSTAGPTPATPTWTPAWAWMGNPQWTGAPQQPLPATLGKRQGGRVEGGPPAKVLRTDVEPSSNLRSRWPMLQGRTPPTEVRSNSTLKQLFQNPKLEPTSVGCEPKDTFMSRLFMNASATRPVPSPLTI